MKSSKGEATRNKCRKNNRFKKLKIIKREKIIKRKAPQNCKSQM